MKPSERVRQKVEYLRSRAENLRAEAAGMFTRADECEAMRTMLIDLALELERYEEAKVASNG